MSDPLMAPTYAEIARAYRHFTLLNGSPVALEYLLAPGVTGSGLQTWLGTPSNLAAFQQLVAAPSGAAAMCASGAAMAAVAASSTAMNTVAASSTAMAAVAASSTAMAAVAASSTARIAVYDSTTAWDSIAASVVAKSVLLSASQEHNTTSTAHTYPTGSGSGIRVAFLQQRGTSGGTSYAGANADTYATTSTTYIDRYVRVTGLTHRSSNSAYTSYIKYIIMQ